MRRIPGPHNPRKRLSHQRLAHQSGFDPENPESVGNDTKDSAGRFTSNIAPHLSLHSEPDLRCTNVDTDGDIIVFRGRNGQANGRIGHPGSAIGTTAGGKDLEVDGSSGDGLGFGLDLELSPDPSRKQVRDRSGKIRMSRAQVRDFVSEANAGLGMKDLDVSFQRIEKRQN